MRLQTCFVPNDRPPRCMAHDAATAEEQNQCLAVVNAAINELNRNEKATQEMGKATECTYILAAGRCEKCALSGVPLSSRGPLAAQAYVMHAHGKVRPEVLNA